MRNILPIYDISKSYHDNVEAGPIFESSIPNRTWAPKKHWIDFLGYQIASPLGVPAGPLLTSQWTSLASQLGFDVVTYKTIRSQPYAGHGLPNIIFVKPDNTHTHTALENLDYPTNPIELNITNSFGMPSMSPEFLQEDIQQARNALQPGQILIVSVVGGSESDFVKTALFAKDAGAHVVEANFSCPNVASGAGQLFNNPDDSYKIAQAITQAIAPTPLLIKVGAYSNGELFRSVLVALARAGVRGICGINSVPMTVVKQNGTPALGPDRATSGVCGSLIRPMALEFLNQAQKLIHTQKLELEITGCGGAVLPEHFDSLLQAGAKVAMSATGMMWNPLLGMQWHERNRPSAS